jgi:hypothetical protein
MDISAKIDEVQGKVAAGAAAAAAPFSEISSGLDELKAGVPAELQGQYSKGYADGVASVVNPGDPSRIFTQADLDAAVAGAKAADQVTIDGLNASIASLEAQVADVPAKVQAGIDAGVAAIKSELLSAYDAAQVAESAVETGFREKLMPPVVPSEPTPSEPSA